MASFLLPLAIGGLSALSGSLQAIGSDQQQRDQIRAQNAAGQRQTQFEQQRQQFERRQALAIRKAQTEQFERNKTNIYEALGLNYNAAQRQLDNAYRSAFYDEQNEAIQLAKQIGSASTRGMSGVSASRVDREPYAERGRNVAIRQQNLKEAGYQYQDETRIMRNRAYSDVLRAFEPISTPLMFGPNIPNFVPQKQPNRLGLYAGIGSSILGGVQTGLGFFS
jgi:hypothetical protein